MRVVAPDVELLPCNVAEEPAVRGAFDSVVQRWGRLDLLFNNAGIGGGGSLFTSSRDQWERTFNICWGGVYLGTRTFLPMPTPS